MSTKIKTVLLLVVVTFLLVTTLYVSYILRNESESAPTTIKKTKAASRTYSKTIALNPTSAAPTPTTIPTPTPTATPVPTQSVAANVSITPIKSAIQNPQTLSAGLTPTITPSATPAMSPTPASALLALGNTTITPTEIVIAQTTSTPTPVASGSAQVRTALPDAGWIKPLHILFALAFSLIFFSLIY